MGFLKKMQVARNGNGNTGKRIANDLTYTKSVQTGVVRELITISTAQFEALSLADKSISFVSEPNLLALIVVKEGSDLALAFHSKREGTSAKSRSFGSPELLSALTEKGIIPSERSENFKAIFKLKEASPETEQYAEVLQLAGENAGDVVKVMLIEHVENTTFKDRVRKAKATSPDVQQLPTAAQAPIEDGAMVAAGGDDDDDDGLDLNGV